MGKVESCLKELGIIAQIWDENGTHAHAALYQSELTYDAPIEADLEVQVLP